MNSSLSRAHYQRNMKCIVYYCTSDENVEKLKHNGLKFHKIPKRPLLRGEWMHVLGLEDNIPISTVNKFGVCSKHFVPNDYCKRNKSRLKRTAVPRITQYRIPLRPKQKNSNIQVSHKKSNLNADVEEFVEIIDDSSSDENDLTDITVSNNTTDDLQLNGNRNNNITGNNNINNNNNQYVIETNDSSDTHCNNNNNNNENQQESKNDEGYSMKELLNYIMEKTIVAPNTETNESSNSASKSQCDNSLDTNIHDDCKIYGEYIKYKLNQFDDRKRSTVEYLISKLLFEADSGRFKHTTLAKPT